VAPVVPLGKATFEFLDKDCGRAPLDPELLTCPRSILSQVHFVSVTLGLSPMVFPVLLMRIELSIELLGLSIPFPRGTVAEPL
jgi:hypothetical protein